MIELTDFKYGKIFVSNKDFYIGKVLLESGQYCDEEIDIVKMILSPNDNIIEVGSNIGSLSIPMSQIIKNGTLYCIEPQQYIYNILCANIAINNIVNIKPILSAIGDINSLIKMPIVNYEEISNFGGVSIIGNDNNGDVVKLLDTLFSDLKSVKLIKMDVEGLEAQVLLGGSNLIKRCRPFIYLENDRKENTNKILSILSDMGYKTYIHISSIFNKPNYKNNNINCFDKNYIAINALAIPNEINETFGLEILK